MSILLIVSTKYRKLIENINILNILNRVINETLMCTFFVRSKKKIF